MWFSTWPFDFSAEAFLFFTISMNFHFNIVFNYSKSLLFSFTSSFVLCCYLHFHFSLHLGLFLPVTYCLFVFFKQLYLFCRLIQTFSWNIFKRLWNRSFCICLLLFPLPREIFSLLFCMDFNNLHSFLFLLIPEPNRTKQIWGHFIFLISASCCLFSDLQLECHWC